MTDNRKLRSCGIIRHIGALVVSVFTDENGTQTTTGATTAEAMNKIKSKNGKDNKSN